MTSNHPSGLTTAFYLKCHSTLVLQVVGAAAFWGESSYTPSDRNTSTFLQTGKTVPGRTAFTHGVPWRPMARGATLWGNTRFSCNLF